jgi:ABC-type proline/glycine betaine transport system ATPase subunit
MEKRLFSLPSLDEALRIGDHALMKDGEIVQMELGRNIDEPIK